MLVQSSVPDRDGTDQRCQHEHEQGDVAVEEGAAPVVPDGIFAPRTS
jgi:hypothetical protein